MNKINLKQKLNKNNQIIKELFISQKDSWKIYPWFLIYTILPMIWLIMRYFLINNLLDANINTYIQWEYMAIFLEIIQQTLLFSLFWWFGKITFNNENDVTKIKEAYLLTFSIYSLILIVLSFFVNDFLILISSVRVQDQQAFFLLQLWSNLALTMQQISIVIFLNSKMYKTFSLFLLVKVSLGILFDFTLANQNVFANPYLGIGLSTFLVESLLFVLSFLFIIYKIGFKSFFRWDGIFNFKTNKTYWSNVIAAFIYSTISNLFYLFMISKNLNLSNTANIFWLSNSIIWNWILLLNTSLFSLNKSILSISDENDLNYQKQVVVEFQILSLVAILVSFAIFIPLYKNIASLISNDVNVINQSYQIFKLVIWSYVLYVSSESINSYFIARGKNWILVIGAFIVNLIGAIPFIILKNQEIITMDAYNVGVYWNLNQLSSFIVNWLLIYISFKNDYLKLNLKEITEKNESNIFDNYK